MNRMDDDDGLSFHLKLCRSQIRIFVLKNVASMQSVVGFFTQSISKCKRLGEIARERIIYHKCRVVLINWRIHLGWTTHDQIKKNIKMF